MNDGHFSTHYTPLAAFLHLKGIQLLDVVIDGKRGVFVFNCASNHPAIEEWQSGKATGDLQGYSNALRYMKELVYRAKDEQRTT